MGMIIKHPQLVRFLKTVLMLSLDRNDRIDTGTILQFIDMIYVYGFIDHDELALLRDFKNTLSKEKHNA